MTEDFALLGAGGGVPTRSDVIHSLPRRFRLGVAAGMAQSIRPTGGHLRNVGLRSSAGQQSTSTPKSAPRPPTRSTAYGPDGLRPAKHPNLERGQPALLSR